MRIDVTNLSKIIRGSVILDNISIHFESGHIYGIIGKNGSGKTMLLRAISGLIVPSSGVVYVDGKALGTEISFPPEIVQAIMENQKLLVLDEPFNALDEKSVKLFRELLIEYKKQEKLIILTSHNKEDIESLCDHTYQIQSGQIIAE